MNPEGSVTHFEHSFLTFMKKSNTVVASILVLVTALGFGENKQLRSRGKQDDPRQIGPGASSGRAPDGADLKT
jgi:hypothetical protein